MTREQKYPDTSTFHFYNANPKGRITGDCTFRAIATALDKPWNEVVMEMAELSCRTGYAINDKKGIDNYMKEQGWEKHKQPVKLNGRLYTAKEFCEMMDKEDKKDNYIVNVGSHHIVAIVEGKVNDIWDSTNEYVGNYWTKKK